MPHRVALQVIVTMRPGAVTALPRDMLKNEWQVLRVESVGDKERVDFFEFLAKQGAWADKLKKGQKWVPADLAKECSAIATELGIPSSPLLLLWLFVAITAREAPFDNEFDLFNLIVDMALSRDAGKLSGSGNLTKKMKSSAAFMLDMVGYLCHRMRKSERIFVRSCRCSFVSESENDDDPPMLISKDVIERIIEQLLVEDGCKEFQFGLPQFTSNCSCCRGWSKSLASVVADMNAKPLTGESSLHLLSRVCGLFHERLNGQLWSIHAGTEQYCCTGNVMFIHQSFQEFLATRFLLAREETPFSAVWSSLLKRTDHTGKKKLGLDFKWNSSIYLKDRWWSRVYEFACMTKGASWTLRTCLPDIVPATGTKEYDSQERDILVRLFTPFMRYGSIKCSPHDLAAQVCGHGRREGAGQGSRRF